VNVGLVNLGVSENLLNRVHSGSEEILAKFLESSTSDGSVEVDTFEERVDLDGSLSGGRKSSLCSLASSTKTSESTSVGRKILLVLSLELGNKVVDKSVVEIFTTQVSVTSGGLDFENAFFNGQEGDIESSSSEIENEDVLLAESSCRDRKQ